MSDNHDSKNGITRELQRLAHDLGPLLAALDVLEQPETESDDRRMIVAAARKKIQTVQRELRRLAGH